MQKKIPDVITVLVKHDLPYEDFQNAVGANYAEVLDAIWVLPDGEHDCLYDNLRALRKLVKRIDREDVIYNGEDCDAEDVAELVDDALDNAQGLSLLDLMRLEMLRELLSCFLGGEDLEFGLIPTITKWIKQAKEM